MYTITTFAAVAFGLLAQLAALAVVVCSLGLAVQTASPTAALAGLAFLLLFFSLVFPRFRKEYFAAFASAVLGGLLAHFNGSASFSSGAFTTALTVFVLSLVCKHFPGCFNVLWRYVVTAVCCLAPVFSPSWRAFLGKSRGTCRNFPELIENVVLMIPLSHITLRELLNEVARRHVQELRFAEQCVTLGKVLDSSQAAVDEFRRVHPNRRLSHCVRRFIWEQIPLAEMEDGLFELSRFSTWERLLFLAGFLGSLLETELARLKAACEKLDEVINKRQQYIASAIQIQKIVVKQTAAYPIVKIPAVARLPSRALVLKPDSLVPAALPPASPRRPEEKKDMSVFEMIVSTARHPRSKSKVLPVTETEVELPPTPDHSHSEPPASPAPAIIEEIAPLSPSTMVQRAFSQIEGMDQALRALSVREHHAPDNEIYEMMMRPRKESAVTKEARFARERSLIAYRHAQAEKEKEIKALVVVSPAAVTSVTLAPAAAAADTPFVLPSDAPAQATAVAPTSSDDLMSELRVALAARERSIRKTTRDDTPAKLKAANATVPATSSSEDEWVTTDESDSDEPRGSEDDDSKSDVDSEGPRGPEDDDSGDGDEDDAPPSVASSILAVVDGEQASPSEPTADAVDDNDKHGSPGPSGNPALPEAEVSFDSEAGAREQAGGSTRDVAVTVGGDKQSEDTDDEPETSLEEEEGESDSCVGVDQQLLVTQLYPPLPPSPTTTTTRGEAETSLEGEAEQKVLSRDSGGSGLTSSEEGSVDTPPVGSSPVVSVEAQTENDADITSLLEASHISTSVAQAVAVPLVTATTTATTDIIGDFTATTADAITTPAAITSPEVGIVQTEEAVMTGTEVCDALPGMELDEGSLARPNSVKVDEEVKEEDSRMEEAGVDDEGEDTAMVIPDAGVEGPPAAMFGSMSMSGTPFAFGAVQDDVNMAYPQQQDFENVEMIDQGVFGNTLMPPVGGYPSLPSQEGDMRFHEADVRMVEPAPQPFDFNAYEGVNYVGSGEQQQQQQQFHPEPMDYHHDVEASSCQQPLPNNFGLQQSALDPSQPDDQYYHQVGQQLAQIDFGPDNQSQLLSESDLTLILDEYLNWSMSQAQFEELVREVEQFAERETPGAWSGPDSLIDPALFALPTDQATDDVPADDVSPTAACAAAPIQAAPSPQGEEVVASPQEEEEEEEEEEEVGASAPTTATAAPVVTPLPEQGISYSFAEYWSDVAFDSPDEDDHVDDYVPVPVAPVLRQEVERRRREPRSNGSTSVEVRADDRQDVVSAEPDSSSSDEESVRQRVARRPMLVPRLRGSVAVRQAVAEQVRAAGESSSAPPQKKTLQEVRDRIEAMRRAGTSNFASSDESDEDEDDSPPSFPIPSTTTTPNFPSEGLTTPISEEREPVAEGSSGSAEVKEGQPAGKLKLKSSEVEAHQGEEAELKAAVAEEEEGHGNMAPGTGRRRKRDIGDFGHQEIEYVELPDIPVRVTEGRRILSFKRRIPGVHEEPD
uniref:Uncharacterized protein n=1 Tax=Podospora anserina (strain S / ATCC MYA-4624 / DSM 980 / FGSC 10383) TaxID=515849 RepID=A0A090C9P3_PODAN|nr:Putative protein of unknown function [Podospora anserina S mat+]